MNDQQQNDKGWRMDADLEALNRALDDLGRHERRSAPAGLEERIYVRTRAAARGDGVLARIGFGGAWRLAAVLTLATLGVAALYVAFRPGGTGGLTPGAEIDMVALERDFDAWLTALDEPSESVEDVATTLRTVEAAYEDFWSDTLLPTEEAL